MTPARDDDARDHTPETEEAGHDDAGFGHEDWRPARETRSQREWQPGQQKKPRSIRVLFASSILVLEAFVLVFFGLTVWGLNRGEDWNNLVLFGAVGLAVVAVGTCSLLRRPLGYWIGWGIQVLMLLGGFLEYTMVVVALGFGLAWWYAVTKGGQLDRENEQRRRAQEEWDREHGQADPQ